jgi:tetratricopeptide (TPR) repeat protein
MAAIMMMKGRLDDAAEHFHKVLSMAPDHADSLVGLSRIAANKSDATAARKLLRQAVAAAPEHKKIRQLMARELLAAGDRAGAREQFVQVLRVSPKDTEALLQLGFLSHSDKDWAQARLRAREVLAIDASHQQAAFLAAAVYATAPDPALRNGPVALELVQRALRGQKNTDPGLQLIAAAAHAECGDFAEAIRLADVVWRLAEASRNKVLAQQVSARLKSYRSNKPWHEPE